MALTNNNINMIRALSEGNTQNAKTYALLSLKEDKTKKNEWATKNLTKKLTSSGLGITEAIPADIKTSLIGLSCHEFDPAKYYLRDNEKQLAEDMLRMSLLAGKLSDMGVDYTNTCLLYGLTGTGKTEFAKYMAHRMSLPLFYVNFSQAIDSYMGNTAKNINKIISFAAQWPCILFLDEIDCIAVKRRNNSEGPNAELARTTVSVMQALDTLPSKVLLIAATNRIDMLDEALLRRFSIKHEFLLMAQDELKAMAYQYLDATGTREYVSDDTVRGLSASCTSPGELMPELIRVIGRAYYAAHKDELIAEAEQEADAEYTDIWDVTEIYKIRLDAESEDEAITQAKKLKGGFYSYANGNAGTTEWKAVRIEK